MPAVSAATAKPTAGSWNPGSSQRGKSRTEAVAGQDKSVARVCCLCGLDLGCQIANINFGLTDASSICSDCEAHSGFLESWETVADDSPHSVHIPHYEAHYLPTWQEPHRSCGRSGQECSPGMLSCFESVFVNSVYSRDYSIPMASHVWAMRLWLNTSRSKAKQKHGTHHIRFISRITKHTTSQRGKSRTEAVAGLRNAGYEPNVVSTMFLF
jgi:hypothetical protein